MIFPENDGVISFTKNNYKKFCLLTDSECSDCTIHQIDGVFYLKSIMNKEKKYEGRVHTEKCRAMKVKEHLKLFDKEAGWGIICEITSIDVFDSFNAMLQKIGVLQLLPHLKMKNYSSEKLLKVGLKIYMDFPGSKRVYTLGAVAIGVKFLKKINTLDIY